MVPKERVKKILWIAIIVGILWHVFIIFTLTENIRAENIRNLEFETGVIIGARVVIELIANDEWTVDPYIDQEDMLIEMAYEIRRREYGAKIRQLEEIK